jgi:hypothetical protein
MMFILIRKVCTKPYSCFVFLICTRTMEEIQDKGISMINQNDANLVQRNHNSDSSDEVINFI